MRGFRGAFVALRSAYYGCPSDVYDQFGMSGMPDRKPCGSFKGSKYTVFGGSRMRSVTRVTRYTVSAITCF